MMKPLSAAPADSHEKTSVRWIELAMLIVIALAARLTYFDRPPKYDEFYHVLAARSWAEEGSLSILVGEYSRAKLFTLTVGVLFRVFDNDLTTARLPALVGGVVWAALVFWWAARHCGRTAAWTAGLLMALAPIMIFLSQICRFYTIHGLCVWMAATALFSLLWTPSDRRRLLVPGALLVATLALALHLQQTTMILVAALIAWTGLVLAYRGFVAPVDTGRTQARWGLVAGVALGAIVLAGAWATGRLRPIVDLYFHSPAWAAADRNHLRFYWDYLLDQYHVLWALFPVAIVLSIARSPRVGVFLVSVFGVSFVLHSLAGAKDSRYMAYALPFFFVTWGLALAVILPALHRTTMRALAPVLRGPRLGRAGSLVSGATVAICVLFVAYNSRAFLLTQWILLRDSRDYYAAWEAEWEPVTPQLRALAADVDLVVTSAGPKALYYLDDYDLEISAAEYDNALHRVSRGSGDRPNWVMDGRLGRPVTATVAGVQEALDVAPSGLVIVEKVHWEAPWAIAPDVAAFLRDHTERVDIDPDSKLLLFRW